HRRARGRRRRGDAGASRLVGGAAVTLARGRRDTVVTSTAYKRSPPEHQMRHTSAVSTVAGVFAGLALALGFIHTPSADDADRSDAVRQAVVGGTARNILLFIGDGMGNSEITLARNYAIGAAGRLALDTLPMTGAYTTYSVEERDPS